MGENDKKPSKLMKRFITITLVVVLVLVVICGVIPAVFHGYSIESSSMEPNIPAYSLVFVSEADSYQTQEEAIASGADKVFNDYGDVIMSHPNGSSWTMIHRAITTITDAEAISEGYNGTHGGYITKGDNTPEVDQKAYFSRYGSVEAVKPEWIIGKVTLAIPLLGWVQQNIVFSIILLIAIIAVAGIVVYIIDKRSKKKEKSE